MINVPGRLLIADDEETFLESTARLLRKEGLECDCASDSDTVMTRLRSHDYSLLIADIRMPGNSGLELVQQLAETSPGLPVILVTGYPSLNSAIQSVQLPVVAYLVKPFDFSELLAHVRRSLDRTRLSRAVHDVEKHLQAWREDMLSIQRSNVKSSDAALAERFMALTLSNVAGCLVDLKRMWDVGGAPRVYAQISQQINCPRCTISTQALKDTIAV
ncbi:MAG TPA: response regulator, partial [Tepidisphaeraceae bacterium]|nr:response regulator [Tepidisphaeraceae bacterium]